MKLCSIQNSFTILLAVQLQLKLEIRSVERGICPIAEPILTDRVIFQCACVKKCLISTSGLKSDARMVKMVNLRLPNFLAIGQTVAEIWRFFDFSKMAAVRYLEFMMRMFRPPTKDIWSLSLGKIWLIWLESIR